MISPLLANIYLHYVFDLWAERWRRRQAAGDMTIVRYADDVIVGLRARGDARRFLRGNARAVREVCVVASSGQDPPLDRVRPLCCGEPQAARARQGFDKRSRRPSTSWASPSSAVNRRRGKFLIKRKTRRDRMRAKLKEVKQELRRRMHQPIPAREMAGGKSSRLFQPLRGADQRPGALRIPLPRHRSLATIAQATQPERWHDLAADRKLANDWLPKPRILHPWPNALRRHTPEVGAVCGNPACTDLCGGRAVMRVPCTLRVSGK